MDPCVREGFAAQRLMKTRQNLGIQALNMRNNARTVF